MKYIGRFIALPFVFLMVVFIACKHVAESCYMWMRYGGEAIIYDEDSKPTINNIYTELVKQREDHGRAKKENLD